MKQTSYPNATIEEHFRMIIYYKNSFISLNQQQKHTWKDEVAKSFRWTQAYKKANEISIWI